MTGILILIKSALKNLLANKLRSFLTILGIAFGIAAVIATLGATTGTRQQINEDIALLGTDILIVYAYPKPGEILHIPLKESDADIIRNMCPSVKDVTSVMSSTMPVKYGRRALHLSVKGVTPNYASMRDYKTKKGRFFNKEDDSSYALVCTLGASAENKLFGKTSPIGKNIILGTESSKIILKVIGVMEEKSRGLEGGTVKDERIYVPFKTASKIIMGSESIYFLAQAIGEDRIKEVASEISFFLKSKRPTIDIYSQKDLLDLNRGILNKLTLSGIILTIICLSIGGIGIMNIMLVSVIERKREIGIRKSIGAKKRDILRQFLAESIIISLLGGTLGVVLGIFLNGFIISRLIGWPAPVSAGLILKVLLFSACVGLFSGIFPAQRAARLDPIEALRSL
jgi:ABC-type antimicrobial peptide transport system permease subunit